MSNLILPTLQDPPRMNYLWPVKKTPRYKTIVQTPASERGEVRIPLQLNPVYDFEYDLSYIKGDFQTLGSDFANLLGFYQNVRGAGSDWLFKDPYDNGATAIAVPNGDFEQSAAIPPVGWTSGGGTVTLTYDTTTQYQGTRSLNVASFAGAGPSNAQALPVVAGQTVSASCVAKFIGGGGTTGAFLEIDFLNSSGGVLLNNSTSTASGDWVPLSLDTVAPAGAVSFLLFLTVHGGTSNGQAEFDLVTAQVMTLGPQSLGFGDGTTTQFQIGRTLAFGGFELMQNVFPTALFIAGTQIPAGPQPSGNQWYCGLENWLFYSQQFTQSAWVKNNVTMLDNQPTAPDGTSTAGKLTQNGTAGNSLAQIVFGPAPGDQVTFSCFLLQGTAGMHVELRFDFLSSNGSVIQQVFGTLATLTAAWRRYSLTTTVPLGAVQTQVSLFIPSGQNANTNFFFAWGAQLERWASANSYVVTTNSAPVSPRGIVTFTAAPALASAITADFSYYYRCRFSEDTWTDLDQFLFQIWELKVMKFQSLLL